MKNICFVIYDFTKKGGAERASAKLSNELVKNNNITLISVFNEYAGVAYHIDRRINLIKIFNTKGHILSNIGIITSKIHNIIKKQEIDIVLSIDVATVLMTVPSVMFTKAKLVVCDRSSCFNETMYASLALRVYAWLGIHFSDTYQVMTEEAKMGCVDKYGVKEDKIIVIPNWIDESAITDAPYRFDNQKIISVGRSVREKNYEGLIKVAEKIKPHCVGWEWHIWGDFQSEYGKKLLESIKEKNLEGFLIHKGTTDNIYGEYPKYSLFVMASKFEGMPNVILEAQGSKLPVVAYDCKTGPSELVINGVNGFLIKINETEEMCKAILGLIKNKRLAEGLSSMSGINYGKFSKSNVLEKWDVIFKGEQW